MTRTNIPNCRGGGRGVGTLQLTDVLFRVSDTSLFSFHRHRGAVRVDEPPDTVAFTRGALFTEE